MAVPLAAIANQGLDVSRQPCYASIQQERRVYETGVRQSIHFSNGHVGTSLGAQITKLQPAVYQGFVDRGWRR